MKVFFDMEFTGLQQNTTPISIGIVSEDSRTFYAEFTDYEKTAIDNWLEKNVIDNLSLAGFDFERDYQPKENSVVYRGDKLGVMVAMQTWLNNIRNNQVVEFWSDCLSYDWVLFCELFGGAMQVPNWIYYIPFDISTLFKMRGINPDISREEFADVNDSSKKHNALWDALVIKECYEKLLLC